MKKILLLLVLLTAHSVFAQVDTKKLMARVEENKNPNSLDSIAKSLNYKGGEVVAVFAQFTIDDVEMLQK